jgi:hypothetical protein
MSPWVLFSATRRVSSAKAVSSTNWHQQAQAFFWIDAKSGHASQLVGACVLLEQNKGSLQATHGERYFTVLPTAQAMGRIQKCLSH